MEQMNSDDKVGQSSARPPQLRKERFSRAVLERLADSLPFRRLAESLFGFDYFISYSWSGSQEYALALFNSLSARGMRCFLDRSPEGFSAGGELNAETARATQYSSSLLVLADRAAFRSLYVPQEVAAFEKRRRLIIPVDIDNTLASARLDSAFAAELCRTRESVTMLESLVNKIGPKELVATPLAPSEEVVDKLVQSYRYTRRMTRRVRILGAFAVVFAVVAALAGLFAVLARQQRDTARHNETQSKANEILTSAASANLLTAEGINALKRREPLEAAHHFAGAIAGTSPLDLANPLLDPSVREQIVHNDSVNRTRLALLDGLGPGLSTLWRVESGATAVRFSPDPARLVVQTRTGLQLWDSTTGRKLAELSRPGKMLSSCTFSPDAKAAVAVFVDDPVPALWETATGRHVADLSGHIAPLMHVAFDHGGKRVVTCAREITAYVWDVATGRRVHKLPAHEDSVLYASFSNDDRMIATACREEAVRVWNAVDGKLLNRFAGHPHGASYVEFTPDGNELVSLPFTWVGQAFYGAGHVSKPTHIDGSARVFSRKTDALHFDLAGHGKGGMQGKIAGSSRLAVSSQDDISFAKDFRLWDLQSGKEVFRTSGEELRAVSRAGNLVVTRGQGGEVVVRDTAGGASHCILQQVQQVLALSDDERWLAAQTTDGALTFFCPTTGESVFRLRGLMGDASVSFDPRGRRFATLTRDQTVRIWSLPRAPSFEASGPRRMHYVRFAPNGESLLAVSSDTSRLLDTTSHRVLTQAEGEIASMNQPGHQVWIPGGPAAHGPIPWFTRDKTKLVLGTTVRDMITGKQTILPPHTHDLSHDGSRALVTADAMKSAAQPFGTASPPLLSVRDLASGKDLKRLALGQVENAWFGPGDQSVVVHTRSQINPFDTTGSVVRLIELAAKSDAGLELTPGPGQGQELSAIALADDRATIVGLIGPAPRPPDEVQPVDSQSGGNDINARTLLRFWSARDGRHQGDAPVHAELVRGIHPARLGALARLWRRTGGRGLESVEGRFADASSDGLRLLTVRESQAWLWDASQGKALADLESVVAVVWVSFSADGRWIVQTATDGTVRLWDARTGGLASLVQGFRSGLSDYQPLDINHAAVKRSVLETRRKGALGTPETMPSLSSAAASRERDRTWVAHADFTPDSASLGFASYDGTARVLPISATALDSALLPALTEIRYGSALSPTGDTIYPSAEERAQALGRVVSGLEIQLESDFVARRVDAAIALLQLAPGHTRSLNIALAAAAGGPRRFETLSALEALAADAVLLERDLESSYETATAGRDPSTLKALLALTSARKAGALSPVVAIARADAGFPQALRLDAVATLGTLADADSAAVGVLVSLLADDDAVVAAEAASVAARLGSRVVSGAVARFEDPNPAVRDRAFGLIKSLGPEAREATSRLVKLLGHSEKSIRSAAFDSLAAIGPYAVSLLTDALKSVDEVARLNAAAVLAELSPASAQAVPSLLNLLRHDPSDRVRATAGRTLSILKKTSKKAEAAIRTALLEGLNSAEPTTRISAIHAIEFVGRSFAALNEQNPDPDPGAVARYLLQMLDDPDSAVRAELTKTLLHVKAYDILARNSPDGIEALAVAIGGLDKADQIRAASNLTLGAARVREAKDRARSIAAYARILECPDPELRGAALDCIRQLGFKAVTVPPAVIKCLSDPDSSVRVSTCSALVEIPGLWEQLVPRLASLVEHTQGISWSYQRKQAAMLLERIGTAARAALPNLSRALHANDPAWRNYERVNYRDVQTAIIKAVAAIDPSDPTARDALERAWKTDAFDTSPRLEAALVLAKQGLGTPEMIKFLTQALTEPNVGLGNKPSDYWDAATTALVLLRSNRIDARAAVDELLSKAQPGVRLATATAWSNAGGDVAKTFPVFESYLNDEDQDLRIMTCQRLGSLKVEPVRAARLLLARLHVDKEGERVRRAAAEALVAIGPGIEAVANEIAALLGDPDSYVRVSIIGALGPFRSTGPNGSPFVLARLDAPDVDTRIAAARALFKHHKAVFGPLVVDRLCDMIDARLKAAAARQPAPTPAQDDEPEDGKLLTEEHGQFDIDALRAVSVLTEIGPDAQAALPRLRAWRALINRFDLAIYEALLRAITGPGNTAR